MNIVFALLAHNNPALVARVIRTMTTSGTFRVVVHYDAKIPDKRFAELKEQVANLGDRVRFARRVKVGWGEWSVVQATLNCLTTIDEAGWEPDYVYLMSGMDYPIRSATDLAAFLERNRGDEFIESIPSDTVDWVKSGPQRERYQYRWFFNWRDHPNLTDKVFAFQKRWKLQRRFVRDFEPHLGSQWWVLTWPTLKAIMDLARMPDVVRFFKTTLIPDELFFQTLVRQVVPDHLILGCPLTLYQFTDYGYPVVYHADHIDYLTRQRFFMARKFSSHDLSARDLLDPYWTGEKPAKPFGDTDVGLRSTEYDDWRFAHRDGPPNHPLAGGGRQRWGHGPRRISDPSFAVLGTSSVELRFMYKILSRTGGVRMHGQLFHPARIEFAAGGESCAGYDASDIEARNMSGMDFLTDVVRAETQRTSGYLLRWGQGGAVVNAVLERPDIRLADVQGDPLVSFAESLADPIPATASPGDPGSLADVQPDVAAYRLREYVKSFGQYRSSMDERLETFAKTRPGGWVQNFDLEQCGQDWLGRLGRCIGTKIVLSEDTLRGELAIALEEADVWRRAVTDLLLRGGIGRDVLEALADRKAAVALSLM